jgi:uracil-DNA glycosylase
MATKQHTSPAIHPSWKPQLEAEFAAAYMQELRRYLAHRKAQSAVVFPHSSVWFNAFALTPFDAVKVVILGQDPYHGPGQAHGLSFSVLPGVAIPPSLLNIYKEIDADLGPVEEPLARSRKGCLEDWAAQGVFLLNSVLTVESGQAASHQGRGWEQFTDQVIKNLSDERENLVFMLWGSYAQKKGQHIDSKRHLVLTAPHPSPLSAHRGFLGCRHFSAANKWLLEHGQDVIDWFAVR